jgi:hypothetical protein
VSANGCPCACSLAQLVPGARRGSLHSAVGTPRRVFRLDATGQGGTVLRKVLGELAGWVEAVDPERANQEGGGERRARFLPSLTKPRRPSRAAAAAAAAAVAAAGGGASTAECHLTWRTGRFKPSEYSTSSTNCRVNHIPGSSAICKKDQLVRNMRKMRKSYGAAFNFVPTSFMVPTEFTKFAQHFADLVEMGTQSTWICKPSGMSRGRKIFLLTDPSTLSYDRPCVVQRYIPRPLLIGGYKWVRLICHATLGSR